MTDRSNQRQDPLADFIRVHDSLSHTFYNRAHTLHKFKVCEASTDIVIDAGHSCCTIPAIPRRAEEISRVRFTKAETYLPYSFRHTSEEETIHKQVAHARGPLSREALSDTDRAGGIFVGAVFPLPLSLSLSFFCFFWSAWSSACCLACFPAC